MTQVSPPLSGRTLPGAGPGRVTAGQGEAIGFAVAACFAAGVALYFHGRFWWPADDGAYAHVAMRLLDGEVLNRDVHDHHLGYINFANALWLWLFGPDLVSLRYPLAVMAFLQAGLIYRLLLPQGPVTALTGSLAMSALSLVQFLNPTAHWYSLFILVLIVCVLTGMPRATRWRLEAIGYLIVTMVLFRQLSGAIVAIGVLGYLLAEEPERRTAGQPWLSRISIGAMAFALAGYLVFKTGIGALLMFGVGPLGALIWAAKVTAKGNLETAGLTARLALGGAAALAPLVAYHAFHGSLASWFDDTVLSALYLTELEFIGAPSFAKVSFFGAGRALMAVGPAELVNGLYWMVLPLLPLALGAALTHGLFRHGRAGAAFQALPFLAAFYAVVSAHYQIPVYLYFSTATTLIGLLALGSGGGVWPRRGMAGAAIAISAVGLWYHAAQPLGRGLGGIVAGEKSPYVRAQGIDRASLWMTAEDQREYRELLALIARETPADGAILALPFDPQLYFLSGRRNPTRFFNLGVGVRDESVLRSVLLTLRRDPPLLVFYRPEDKYNTGLTARIMDFVRVRYRALAPRGGLEIYRYRPDTSIYMPAGGAKP